MPRASVTGPKKLHAIALLVDFSDNVGTRPAAEFQKIVSHPGLTLNFATGPLARLGLARAYAASGDRANARKAYQDLLGMWKDADPDLRLASEAKAEYQRVQ